MLPARIKNESIELFSPSLTSAIVPPTVDASREDVDDDWEHLDRKTIDGKSYPWNP